MHSTAPAIINPDGNVTTTIPPGGLEYFQTECPAYTNTVLVELTDLNGTNFLYASTTVDNPGPLTDNTLRNETTGISRRTLTLPIPSGSNVSLNYSFGLLMLSMFIHTDCIYWSTRPKSAECFQYYCLGPAFQSQ